MKIRDTLKNFENPGKEYRGLPFWSWNTKITPDEAKRQIKIIKEMGFGGFFIHARVGLDIPYLQRKWFDCVKASVEEAEKLDLSAWLYDEDRWPSGSAGGMVTRDNDELSSHGICCEPANNEQPSPGTTIAFFAIVPIEKKDGSEEYSAVDLEKGIPLLSSFKNIKSYRRVKSAEEKPRKGEIILRFFVYMSSQSPWFNNGRYLDVLSKKAVRKFIDITHEAYAREVGDKFGKSVPGIFFDEPNYIPNIAGILAGNHNYTSLPWTEKLPSEFKKYSGGDILDILPELLYVIPGKEFSQARYDYFHVVTLLFTSAFAGQIGKWCTAHGISATGHVLEEDTLFAQARSVGAAMQSYESMEVPGIDILTEKTNFFDTAKQCSSVARQFGRSRRLTEIYGCTGWDFPMEGHKALGDWQLALGINVRCLHLIWYSMQGERKRDYPASIFRQSPWWTKYSEVEDYFARLNSVMTSGKELVDLLVIHPIESMWGQLAGNNRTKKMVDLDISFTRLRNELLFDNLDFDYGDEELMSRHASVDKGLLRVGKSVYKAVAMQELCSIRSTTLKLLADFAAAGGLVTYEDNPPKFVDGKKSNEAAKIFKAFKKVTRGKTAQTVAPIIRRVSVKEDGKEVRPTLCLMTDLGDALALFVCNTSTEFNEGDKQGSQDKIRSRKLAFPNAEITVFTPEKGFVRELDPLTGKIHSVDFVYSDGAYHFAAPLERLASRLFLITDKKLAEVLPAINRSKPAATAETLPASDLKFSLDEDNVIVLDHAKYKIGMQEETNETFILQIDDIIRDTIGIPRRGGGMCQPWAQKIPNGITVPFELTYNFRCVTTPKKDCFLALEMADRMTIEINGHRIEKKNAGFWMDPCMVKIPIPHKFLVKGENKIVLAGKYSGKMSGLEAMFLMGNFGVDEAGAITDFPKSLNIGDWVPQGLPNYTGNLTYNIPLPKIRAGEKALLRVPKWRGAALGIGVNGGEQKLVPWPPYELDISGMLSTGKNTLNVTVYGNRRNAFGPFYFKDTAEMSWYGPGEMKRYESSERELVMMGLIKPLELVR